MNHGRSARATRDLRFPRRGLGVVAALLALAAGRAVAQQAPASQASAAAQSAPAAARTIEVTFDAALSDKPFTGRVWVFTSRSSRGQPREGPNWLDPEPCFALDVRDWKPGAPLRFDDAAITNGEPLSRCRLGGLRAQAVLGLNPLAREPGTGAGNGYSKTATLNDAGGVIQLHIDQRVRERPFRGTSRIRPFEIESRLLSRFHGRAVKLAAAVILPPEYAGEPQRRFAALYIFPGFGQGLRTSPMYARAADAGELPLVQVLLDGECPTGFHEFADSANNGPCGQALIEELIPALEKEFRLVAEPAARFTTGHSSGGWASLWVQIAYPDYFGGCWSTSPDPVDFRDLCGVNIYEPDANVYVDRAGGERPMARRSGPDGDVVLTTWRQFARIEVVTGRGGQLGSLEAVFSPRTADGSPMPLFDRRTGRVDPAVAKAWEKYDIRLLLERNWPALKPKLAGKLHVYTGSKDTFYLEGAVRLLRESLTSLGSDADVRILDGHDHGSIMLTPELQGIRKSAGERFRAHAGS